MTQKTQEYKLAEIIWDGLNEVDYDPMHPKFKHFEDKIKDDILAFAATLLPIPRRHIGNKIYRVSPL